MATSLCRALAIDLRSSKFGYVVFEGPQMLLDWGVMTHERRGGSSLEIEIKNLQSLFTPSIILTRGISERYRQRQPAIRRASQTLRTVSAKVFIAVRLIDDSSLYAFFARSARTNKYEIAQIIAARFPELAWHLPPRRRPWQSEPTRQMIFDAASLGIVYFAERDDDSRDAASHSL